MDYGHIETIGGPTEADDIEYAERQREEETREPDDLEGDDTLPGEAID